MVKRPALWRAVAAGLLCAVCLPLPAAPRPRAAPYELDRQTLALGEPLALHITRAVNEPCAPLETLDFAPLRRDFDVVERTFGRDDRQESLTLTLYPRHVGRIELPAFGRPGRGLSVLVTEGSDTVPKVYWKLSVDPAEPLVRQPTTFTLEACDDGTLLWKRPELPAVEGLMLRALHETEIVTQRDNKRCTAHRWHWVLLPTAAGPLSLNLPVMEAGKFGKRLRFVPPAFALQARALPGWLPVDAAVGPVEIVTEALPAQAVLDQPLAWRLRVTGAYSAQALQTLFELQLRQAGGATLGTAYAPRVETLASMNPAAEHRVTLYLLPRERGSLVLPALQLPWYDPARGQLMQAQLAGSRMEVADPVRQRWLVGAEILGGVIACAAMLAGIWKVMGWRWRRWRAVQGLSHAQTLEGLCQQLLAFSRRPGDAPAPTLRTWHTRMETQWVSTGLADLVTTLERQRFGSAAAPTSGDSGVGELVKRTCAWLRQVKPR